MLGFLESEIRNPRFIKTIKTHYSHNQKNNNYDFILAKILKKIKNQTNFY